MRFQNGRHTVYAQTLAGLIFTLAITSIRADESIEFFEKKIRPILVTHCYQCHSAQAAARNALKGDLRLDSRDGVRAGGETGPVVVPGKPGDSLLISAIRHDALSMPPKGMLPDNVIADFEKWIRIGAPDPRDGAASAVHTLNAGSARKSWPYQPLRSPQIPAVKDVDRLLSNIDRFVSTRLAAESIPFAPVANKRTLLRRASYDLLGLPPTPQEVDAFLSNETPEAFANAVDRLLRSPDFGVRWARHWLDNVRYSQDDPTCAANDNGSFNIAPYRDWVVRSFNEDLPYDQFVQMQIAGDLLPTDDSELINADALTATGIWGLAHLVEGNDREKVLADFVDEQLDVFGRTFLGLTVSCARCHDHKFDPISQDDYYSLAGIFYSSHIFTFRGKSARLRDRVEFRVLHTKTEQGEFREKEQKLQNTKTEIAVLKKQHGKAFELFRLRRDLQTQMQQTPVTDKDKADVEMRVQELRKKESELVDDQKKHGWDANAPEVQRLAELTSEHNSLRKQIDAVALRMVMREGPVPETRHQAVGDIAVFVRGDHLSPGKKVPRGFPQVLRCSDAPQDLTFTGSGRLELARWITHPNHPLTARVMANRIWQHLFGTGIVATPDNFGKLGLPPTHPELLDYLAVRLVQSGWSVKSLIREIMLSNTYRQSGIAPSDGATQDPNNRWLGRMNRKRLTAEALKDTLLWHSGLVKRSEADQLPQSGRALYDMSSRDRSHEMLTLFDGPDPELIIPRRADSTSAPQALFMLNNPLVMSAAKAVARNVVCTSDDETTRVTTFYQRFFGRPPSTEEHELAVTVLQSARTTRQTLAENGTPNEVQFGAWEDLCVSMICSNEFLYVD